MAVAAFSDTALTAALAAGVLARHKADVGHQPARMVEPEQVAQFAGECHDGHELETAEPLERPYELPRCQAGRSHAI